MTTSTDTQIYTAASAIGIVAGMRAFAAPAIVAQLACRGTFSIGCEALKTMGKRKTANVLSALSVGELIGDKVPTIPKRTRSFALITRIISGAVCGAVLCASRKRPPVLGAMAGAFGATGGTFAAYHLRKAITESLGLPGPAVAVAEDALAIGLGVLITKSVA